MENNEILLSVKNFGITFKQYEKGLKSKNLEVISNLDVEIRKGEIVAVVGSSGSGKSLLAHAILGILPRNAAMSGELLYEGMPLTAARLKNLRGSEISLIPQSVNYLDPLMKVGKQVIGKNNSESQAKAVFERYNLPAETMDLYPHELSGGMARRVLVSNAVIAGSKLIIADEPTPGLSEDLANEALSHLRELADNGCGIMLITHDINLALKVSDKIAVFYAGTTVEVAQASDFVNGTLRHPYTKALWRALPQNGFEPLLGTQPYSGTSSGKCAFFDRCGDKTESCSQNISMKPCSGGMVRCLYAN